LKDMMIGCLWGRLWWKQQIHHEYWKHGRQLLVYVLLISGQYVSYFHILLLYCWPWFITLLGLVTCLIGFGVSTKDQNVGAGVNRRGGESPYGTL
jgi:hypothetical protein